MSSHVAGALRGQSLCEDARARALVLRIWKLPNWMALWREHKSMLMKQGWEIRGWRMFRDFLREKTQRWRHVPVLLIDWLTDWLTDQRTFVFLHFWATICKEATQRWIHLPFSCLHIMSHETFWQVILRDLRSIHFSYDSFFPAAARCLNKTNYSPSKELFMFHVCEIKASSGVVSCSQWIIIKKKKKKTVKNN